MTQKFAPGDLVKEILSGKEFRIVKHSFRVTNAIVTEAYDLMDLSPGFTHIRYVTGFSINNYVLSQNYVDPIATTIIKDPSNQGKARVFLDGEEVGFFEGNFAINDVPVEISISVDCDHEWVTWTGLFGTTTDCSKCKAVK